ncbi:MAG TPA: hypothetical protein VKT28_20865 [Puia sp.]|nr:hypothetical protein [Puia sp.]
MSTTKKSQKPDEKEETRQAIGKRHDDEMPNEGRNQRNSSIKKEVTDMHNKKDKHNQTDEKRIEIDDNPEETERKIPRMKH